MSKDEKAAAKAWKEFHKAVYQEPFEAPHRNGILLDKMYNAFFAGFYRGRDYQVEKHNSSHREMFPGLKGDQWEEEFKDV